MPHLPHLITDLGLILGAAGVTTLVFKKLKQPLVLGYIIAGFLVGPNFNLFPTITEIENINTWGEIGVIFLLFGLGLEFSFKKLIKVGGTAAIAAIIGVTCTITLGYIIGQLMKWEFMDSLFLGGILGIASTTIIIRAFDELGVKTKKFAEVVMGVLVIEDLVAVVLLVLLSTVAVSRQFSGTEMLESVLKLAFFLVLWFLSGIFFIPTFLKRTQKIMNDETTLIVSLALCFLMVVLASKAGFSSALGAFIMGSILAETVKGVKIEHLLQPVKDLFGAIFFVSVGMLINPQMLVTHIWPILIGTLVLLIGKPIFVMGGAILSGQPLKTSVRAGMSLSQIGEFSFIIATLGLSLKVTSDFLYPIAVAISVVTAFTTPYMIRLSEPTYKLIERVLPNRWQASLKRYSTGAQTITSVSDWKKILRAYSTNIVIYSVILVSIIFLSLRYLQPVFKNNEWGNIATLISTLFFMSPFLWALSVRRSQPESYANIWMQRKYRGPLIMLQLLRIALAILIIGFLTDQLFSVAAALIIAIGVVFVLILFSKRIQGFYNHIEARFLTNLNEREQLEKKESLEELTPWDAHIAHFQVAAESPVVGKTLRELQLRERFGVNIAMLERGNRVVMAPGRHEQIFPSDNLSAIGTDEQLDNFRTFLDEIPERPTNKQQKQEVILKQFVLKQDSSLLGLSIRDSKIRERTKGIIVGIERAGERILNPDSTMIFQEKDVIWIVGNIKRIQVLLNEAAEQL